MVAVLKTRDISLPPGPVRCWHSQQRIARASSRMATFARGVSKSKNRMEFVQPWYTLGPDTFRDNPHISPLPRCNKNFTGAFSACTTGTSTDSIFRNTGHLQEHGVHALNLKYSYKWLLVLGFAVLAPAAYADLVFVLRDGTGCSETAPSPHSAQSPCLNSSAAGILSLMRLLLQKRKPRSRVRRYWRSTPCTGV